MSNQAKDWQKGYYTILVDGKTLVVSKKVKTGKNEYGFPTYKHVTATSQCAPEDEFSLSMGVALAMDRLNKKLSEEFDGIKVGDKVRIKDCVLSYTTYVDWITKNVDDVKLVTCYAYESMPRADETTYVVKAIAPWGTDKNDPMLAFVQRYFVFNGKIDTNQPCYLIDIDGLEKIYG